MEAAFLIYAVCAGYSGGLWLATHWKFRDETPRIYLVVLSTIAAVLWPLVVFVEVGSLVEHGYYEWRDRPKE